MRHSTRSEVDPFIVMDVMEAARAAEEAGRDIVHMEVGQPGSGAPEAARARLRQEMERGPLGYTVALGRPDLRAAIAELFDAGEKVALGEPCYPSYRQILTALSLRPVGLVTEAETRFQPVAEQLTDDLAGLIVASPANPTGTMLGKAELQDLSDACEAKCVSLISDEIYHGLQYEGRAVSALEVTDEVYVINSFSKYFSMTGWRLGWMVVPPDHVRSVERLAQNMFICPAHASQVAALGALSPEGRAELDEHRVTYARNREILLAGLKAAGLTNTAPADGAFYVYADVGHLTDDSRALAGRILDEAGVAVTPGLDFDKARGHRTLRFSYARGTAEIEEGVARLTRFFARG